MLEEKRIVIFGPTFPTSDLMFTDIKDKERVYYNNKPVKNKLSEYLLRGYLNRVNFVPFKKIWRRLFCIPYIDNNTIIIYCNPWYRYMYLTGFVHEIKKIYPGVMQVVYFSDLHSANKFLNKKTKEVFDEMYSFDEEYSIKHGIKYFPLMTSHYNMVSVEPKWKVVFVGQSKGRIHILREIFAYLYKNNIEAKCIITNHDKIDYEFGNTIEYLTGEMDACSALECLMNSECVLEIKSEGIDALSDRVIKAIVNNKKILTNNQTIKRHKYYSTENIQIFDDVNEIDLSFFSSKCKGYNYEGEYSPNCFLASVIEQIEKKNHM